MLLWPRYPALWPLTPQCFCVDVSKISVPSTSYCSFLCSPHFIPSNARQLTRSWGCREHKSSANNSETCWHDRHALKAAGEIWSWLIPLSPEVSDWDSGWSDTPPPPETPSPPGGNPPPGEAPPPEPAPPRRPDRLGKHHYRQEGHHQQRKGWRDAPNYLKIDGCFLIFKPNPGLYLFAFEFKIRVDERRSQTSTKRVVEDSGNCVSTSGFRFFLSYLLYSSADTRQERSWSSLGTEPEHQSFKC